MIKKLKAVRGLIYPESGESLKLVRDAGGVSKLTPKQRARVRFRQVEPGERCDDLPPESRAHLVEKGAVEVVEEPEEESNVREIVKEPEEKTTPRRRHRVKEEE